MNFLDKRQKKKSDCVDVVKGKQQLVGFTLSTLISRVIPNPAPPGSVNPNFILCNPNPNLNHNPNKQILLL